MQRLIAKSHKCKYCTKTVTKEEAYHCKGPCKKTAHGDCAEQAYYSHILANCNTFNGRDAFYCVSCSFEKILDKNFSQTNISTSENFNRNSAKDDTFTCSTSPITTPTDVKSLSDIHGLFENLNLTPLKRTCKYCKKSVTENLDYLCNGPCKRIVHPECTLRAYYDLMRKSCDRNNFYCISCRIISVKGSFAPSEISSIPCHMYTSSENSDRNSAEIDTSIYSSSPTTKSLGAINQNDIPASSSPGSLKSGLSGFYNRNLPKSDTATCSISPTTKFLDVKSQSDIPGPSEYVNMGPDEKEHQNRSTNDSEKDRRFQEVESLYNEVKMYRSLLGTRCETANENLSLLSDRTAKLEIQQDKLEKILLNIHEMQLEIRKDIQTLQTQCEEINSKIQKPTVIKPAYSTYV